MAMTLTEHPHIVCEARILHGEPVIKGTRTPVRAIVELTRLGYSPERIQASLPYLTPAQIYDALSYYHDHPQAIEGYIQRNAVPEDLVDPLVRDL